MTVLLPAPLRPRRQTRSPRSIANDASARTGGPPKARLTSCMPRSAMMPAISRAAHRGGVSAVASLHEIPLVAVQVEKDDDVAIRFVARLLDETYAARLHALVVAREAIGV